MNTVEWIINTVELDKHSWINTEHGWFTEHRRITEHSWLPNTDDLDNDNQQDNKVDDNEDDVIENCNQVTDDEEAEDTGKEIQSDD